MRGMVRGKEKLYKYNLLEVYCSLKIVHQNQNPQQYKQSRYNKNLQTNELMNAT